MWLIFAVRVVTYVNDAGEFGSVTNNNLEPYRLYDTKIFLLQYVVIVMAIIRSTII